MGLVRLTAPAQAVATLEEAQLQTRSSEPVEASRLTEWIAAATEKVEEDSRRALITQQWKLTRDAFPAGEAIRLPLPPLQSVESVKYIDTDGVLQTLVEGTDYVVRTDEILGEVVLAYGKTWPSTRTEPGAVRIEFTCGYGDEPSDVPSRLKSAVLMATGTLYANRETTAVVAMSKLPHNYDWLIGNPAPHAEQ